MIVSRAELADFLGISLPTVDARERKGMPYASKPGEAGATEWRYDTAEVVRWHIEEAQKDGYPTQKQAVDLRIAEAEAVIKEVKALEALNRVIPVEEMVRILGEKTAVVKSRFLALPGRLAQSLAAESDPAAVRRILDAEVSDALGEINEFHTNAKDTAVIPETELTPTEAEAKPNRRRAVKKTAVVERRARRTWKSDSRPPPSARKKAAKPAKTEDPFDGY